MVDRVLECMNKKQERIKLVNFMKYKNKQM